MLYLRYGRRMNVKHQLQCGLNLKKKVQNFNSTKKTFKLQVYRKNNFEDAGGIFNEIRKKIHKCNRVLFQS